jgi:hypothetical protein
MSVYMPIIKLTQRRKGAKNLRTFYYGYATGHDITLCCPNREAGSASIKTNATT